MSEKPKTRVEKITGQIVSITALIGAVVGLIYALKEGYEKIWPPVPPSPEEIVWISPKVTADMTEDKARALLGAKKEAVVQNGDCFTPPIKKEGERHNWKFFPVSAVTKSDQFTCNSDMANAGWISITEKSEDKICLGVNAHPQASGVYHCNTTGHVEVLIRRPRD
ncbi:hypothetical protein ACW7BJ_01715 [Azospirillum argentinense]